ncbi:ankyrin repeat domain-containing protein [Psychrobacter frigidicola]|uniref:Ankyrin repeat domain-containing protein n=1 Tax=Psychrobacter frigidicola TaxID=45611 RepID=A0A5C7A9U5_9GAMM|nr:ankyrin repeat domain-containing protein [Psychrobacter frigidicola]TXD97543.1 ankyrin repeat domain-containing protein [Psychrobacter frigidicola]
MSNTSTKKTPYFFPAEVVRAIARAIDSKNDSESLDNKCHDLYLSKNELDQLINIHIYKVIERVELKKSVENELKALVAQIFDDYLKVVATYNLSERNRDDIGPWILEAFFCPNLINIIYFLGIRTKPFEKSDYVKLMVDNSSSLEPAFKVIEKRIEGWNTFYAVLSKNDKDKITAWRRGADLPSRTSLMSIFNTQNAPKNVLVFLLTARAIEYFKRSHESDIFNQYIEQPRSLDSSMVMFEEAIFALETRDTDYVHRLFEKNDDKFRNSISAIRMELLAYSVASFAKNDLEQAKKRFIDAFDLSLYRSGHICEKVIEVGFVIASWQESPDMNLITKLKSIQALYGYTLPTIVTKDTKRKKENLVEDWEINMWRSNAQRVFNEFKVELPEKYKVSSAVLPIRLNAEELTLDLKKPNKKVKINNNDKLHRNKGKSKQVTTQLIWNTLRKDLDAVNQLLQTGADINILSDNNESALLVALQHMNLTDIHEPDDRFYQTLKDLEYVPKTINAMTSKKHLLPLLSAVQTGRTDVVEHILNLGADVNQKGGSGHLDALTTCISLIGTIKNSKMLLKQFSMITEDPETAIARMSDFEFSAFIRETQGSLGLNRQEVTSYLIQSMKSSDEMAILKELSEVFKEHSQANYELFDLREMRKIAKLLIDEGANPSSKYDWHGIDGYTPFLLACELNEAELVSHVLDNATEDSKDEIINMVYRDRRYGKAVGYEKICKHFKADNVLEVIDRHSTLEISDSIS